ncbi:MAG TPA: hypothetical protein VMW27_05905, partial [Thermoanaerobaculia bacterium]|nr:hypothetical protein [Thermoanaerobaculia bacterium]
MKREWIARLAALLCAVAALLSLKTSWDLIGQAEQFPSWFVPLFVAGVAGLVAWAGLAVMGIWRRRAVQPAEGGLATAVWLLLPLSFVCTSSVHQFFPFRPAPLAAYRDVVPMLGFNLALTGFAFLAVVGLALLYRFGRRDAAILGLMALGFLLLVPNDDCANPFNERWIATVGASPLMFLPNLYAGLFA